MKGVLTVGMRILGVVTALLAVSAAAGVAFGQNAGHAIDGRMEKILDSAEPGERISAWVYFTEKPGLARPADALVSERSLERRRRVLPPSMVVDRTDLPVDERFVAAVVQTGALLRERSKWLNAVSLSATPDQLRALAALPFVRLIEPLLRDKLGLDRECEGESVRIGYRTFRIIGVIEKPPDLGFGGGYFTLAFAKKVGKGSKVYAADMKPEYLAFIGPQASRAG